LGSVPGTLPFRGHKDRQTAAAQHIAKAEHRPILKAIADDAATSSTRPQRAAKVSVSLLKEGCWFESSLRSQLFQDFADTRSFVRSSRRPFPSPFHTGFSSPPNSNRMLASPAFVGRNVPLRTTRSMRGRSHASTTHALDRCAAPNPNFVLVATRHNGLARRARQETLELVESFAGITRAEPLTSSSVASPVPDRSGDRLGLFLQS
jgi:hypothetical protein